MDQIGRYQIRGELGRGAMGVVYRAEDPAIGRTVAIKTIRLAESADPAEQVRLRQRLLHEARSAGALSHPGIVTVYDVAEENELAYVAMEFVNGPSLEQILAGDREIDRGMLLRVLRETAAALDYAHQQGIVHRDIKPANIMVHEDGRAKITDFGVAKISASHQLTQAGAMLGTPSYMSPEQIEGKPVDGRSDVFSLGVIAYEMLTGEKPFVGEQLATILYKIVNDRPAPPHLINPTLSWQVEVVLNRALEKDPAARYATCSEFVKALEGACKSSKNWKPLPRRGSQTLPTVAAEAPEFTRRQDRARPREPGGRTRGKKAMAAAGFAALAVAALTVAYFARLPERAQAPRVEPTKIEQPAPPGPSGRPSPAGPAPGAPESGQSGAALPQEPPPAREEHAAPPAAEAQTAAPAQAPATKTQPAPQPSPPPPAPGESVVLFRTSPPGATLILNNNPRLTCKTPCSLPLPNGRHTAYATLAGHRSALRIFHAPADTDLFLYLARMSGQVQILTTPPGATILIDGDRRNETTPVTLDLPPGKYTVAVSMEGYKTDQQAIEVKDNAFTRLEFILGK